VGLGEFLQAVLSGEVKPIGRTQDAGLQCLVFANYVIDEYWHGKFKLLAGDVLTIREAARLLGVTLDATYLLVKKGFLRAEKSVNTRSLGLVVRRSELDSFTETYLLAKEVAREHDTSQKRIVELFRRGGVSPISGPEAARRHIYLFNRVDLASLDWEHLVEIERKSRAAAKQLSSYIYDEQRVAEMLNTDVVTVRLMAKRGVLKPYKHLLPDGRNGGTYCFSRAVLQRYKKQAGDLTGLVAYQAAVRLFGVKLDTFRNKFVKTGRLKPAIAASGGSKRFFNAEDVEALLEVEKLTIMTAETAKILGVKLSGVDKLMTSGDLKPISGPTVDGFGKNLFLRSNVEKLRMERDSFKANQVQAGKSNRFGRTAGPRSRPVRDLIGPRIDQLIETWQQQTPNLRITGQRLYQQLTSEGYQVGINTIYVHLRKDRWRGEGVSRF
jgi:excisionase family DNA binding protein